jgi:hypothetical protein
MSVNPRFQTVLKIAAAKGDISSNTGKNKARSRTENE